MALFINAKVRPNKISEKKQVHIQAQFVSYQKKITTSEHYKLHCRFTVGCPSSDVNTQANTSTLAQMAVVQAKHLIHDSLALEVCRLFFEAHMPFC